MGIEASVSRLSGWETSYYGCTDGPGNERGENRAKQYGGESEEHTNGDTHGLS